MTKSLIVCVDDDETMLATVARCLRREPSFEVRSSTSCQEVLGWIANDQVAVVVSDYEMPEMTGAQLAGQAKRIRPETVRILLTGARPFYQGINSLAMQQGLRERDRNMVFNLADPWRSPGSFLRRLFLCIGTDCPIEDDLAALHFDRDTLGI